MKRFNLCFFKLGGNDETLTRKYVNDCVLITIKKL